MSFRRTEIKQVIETYARGFAADSYTQLHPGCTEAEAWHHSERHWRDFIDDAISFMAMTQVIEESEAAPWN